MEKFKLSHKLYIHFTFIIDKKRCKQCLCSHKHEKSPEPLMRIGCIFLLVEAPTPNPGEPKMFWVTLHGAAAGRLEIAIEHGKFFVEDERVVISRLFHLAA